MQPPSKLVRDLREAAEAATTSDDLTVLLDSAADRIEELEELLEGFMNGEDDPTKGHGQ